jgi:hypothetical protein
MKALEAQYGEIREALLDKKLCGEADLKQFTALPTMEERLSRIKTFAAGKGITESARKQITRNNGRGVDPTATEKFNERVKTYAKKHKVSIQEATLMLGGKLETTIPDDIAEGVAAWRKYCKTLTIDEAISLVRRGVPVPTN